MYINGRYRLACQTNIVHLHTDQVDIQPLPHLPLVKDLVCDMDDFFAKYEYIQPWLIRKSEPPTKEMLQSPADRHKLRQHAHRLHPLRRLLQQLPVGLDRGELPGPGGAAQGLPLRGRLRDEARRDRLPQWDNERGVYRCHTITNCSEACSEGAGPHGGHPVAQDGGRAPEVVRQGEVTRDVRRGRRAWR